MVDEGANSREDLPKTKVTEGGTRVAGRSLSDFKSVVNIREDGQFVAAVVSYVVSSLDAAAGFVFAPGDSEGAPAPCIANRMSQGLSPQLVYSPEIKSAVSEVFRTRQGTRKRLTNPGSDQAYCFLAVPVPAGDGALLVLGALIGQGRFASIDECHLALGLVAQWFEARRQISQFAALEAGYKRTRVLLEIFEEAGQADDYLLSMSLMADELKRFIGCHQVALAIGDHQRMRVTAISGAGKHDKRGQTASLLKRVMREVAGVGQPIGWPVTNLPDEVLPAGNQDDLCRALHCESTLAIPLNRSDGSSFGAWLCTWEREKAGRIGESLKRSWELLNALNPHVAVVIQLIHLSKPRGWRAKLAQSLKRTRAWKKLAVPLFSTGLIAALFIPFDFRITADCRLQPSLSRHIAAPFDALLVQSEVEPGQLVEEGQVLARLDPKDLSWRLAKARADQAAKLKLRDEAMAGDDVASAQLAQLDADSLGLDIDFLSWQVENLEIRSPIPGVLLSGNLEQSTGVPVQKGKKLFEIAPIDTLEVEIAIEDSASSYVGEGMPVQLRLEAHPDRTFECEVSSVHPVSEIQDNENVFICYAILSNEDGLLRPGMRGRARVVSHGSTLGWWLFHKPIDFLRVHFWW